MKFSFTVRENIHGFVRRIVYFKDKNEATVNSKVVLQFFINRKKCEDEEELQYTAPIHGISGADKPFFAINKTNSRNFKKQVSHKFKQGINVLYDSLT